MSAQPVEKGLPPAPGAEQNPVHVYAYRRSTRGTYDLVADSADMLKLDEPFPISLSISDITP